MQLHPQLVSWTAYGEYDMAYEASKTHQFPFQIKSVSGFLNYYYYYLNRQTQFLIYKKTETCYDFRSQSDKCLISLDQRT